MAHMLVQHAHALVAIAAEAEAHAHQKPGDRGAGKVSYTVYANVASCVTQAVRAISHLTDHLLDPALDRVAGAKPRFATKFAEGFEGKR